MAIRIAVVGGWNLVCGVNAAHPNGRDRRLERVWTALIVIAAVLPFLQSVAFGYILDDTYAIRGNVTLRGWDSLGRVWTEQFGGDGGPFHGLYRPVTMTLFAFLFNAGARWPVWFHVVAIVAHAVVSVVVFRLLLRAVPRTPAALLALWFAVHPVHVEAVANITNSSEILVGLWTCVLAAQLSRVADTGREATWRDAGVAGALYLGAAFSKESGVMAAPIALLFAWGWHRNAGAPDARGEWRRWKTVLAAFGVAMIVVMAARALVLGGPVAGRAIAAIAFEGMSDRDRIVAMLALGPTVAGLLLWPMVLNPHYGPSAFPASPASTYLWFAVTLAMLSVGFVVSLRAAKTDRRWLVAIGWTLLAFLPASNLFVATGQVLAERTLYVPSIGAAMLLALVVAWFAGKLPDAARLSRLVAVAIPFAVIGMFAVRSAMGTQTWRGNQPIFDQMIAADTSGYTGYWQSGVEATLQGRPAEGLAFFEQAYARYKRDRGLILDLGAALTNDRQFARAVAVYREGLKLAPGDSALTTRLAALGVK
jgi:protein O-mannosyl-transferase